MYYDTCQQWTASGRADFAPAMAQRALQLAIDSGAASSERISEIIVTDVSGNCLSNGLTGLIAGERITLDLPLIGRREVEIRWVGPNRAGCRLLAPIGEEELLGAVRESRALAEYFPGLRSASSPSHWGRA